MILKVPIRIAWRENIIMTDLNLEESCEIVLDDEKIKRMVKRITQLERTNAKTDNIKEKEMKNKIIEIIEEEAKKCY
jgi:hypothetical protein